MVEKNIDLSMDDFQTRASMYELNVDLIDLHQRFSGFMKCHKAQ